MVSSVFNLINPMKTRFMVFKCHTPQILLHDFVSFYVMDFQTPEDTNKQNLIGINVPRIF